MASMKCSVTRSGMLPSADAVFVGLGVAGPEPRIVIFNGSAAVGAGPILDSLVFVERAGRETAAFIAAGTPPVDITTYVIADIGAHETSIGHSEREWLPEYLSNDSESFRSGEVPIRQQEREFGCVFKAEVFFVHTLGVAGPDFGLIWDPRNM